MYRNFERRLYISCRGNQFRFNRFPVYFDAAQYMCQAVSQFRSHLNDAYLGVFVLSTESRILRRGTRRVWFKHKQN